MGNNPQLEDLSWLRSKYLDGNDRFMKGCRVARLRVAKRKFPELFLKDAATAAFLRMRFPLMNLPGRDKDQALRWLVVIHRHWRGSEAAQTIEEEKGWKPGTVASLAQQIRWAADGLRLDGRPRTGNRRGRPKKKVQDLGAESAAD